MTDGLRRISLELPVDLVRRLERQAEMLDMGRNLLIETACLGLVNDFERIDGEEGRPTCQPCSRRQHGVCRWPWSDGRCCHEPAP